MKNKWKWFSAWFVTLLIINVVCLVFACCKGSFLGASVNGIAVGMDFASLGFCMASSGMEEKKK